MFFVANRIGFNKGVFVCLFFYSDVLYIALPSVSPALGHL